MKKLVIIEDDIPLAEMMMESINELPGYQCTSIFSSVKDFMTHSENWDILLLDIVLPNINGLEAIESILGKYPNISIVINSIKDDSDTIFNAIQLGAVGYIDKQSFEMNFKEVFDCISHGGAYMTPKIARKVVNYFQKSKNKIEQLTQKEMDIAQGIIDGLSYKLIAEKQAMTLDSVRTLIKRIYRKLNISSKGELLNLFR